MSARVYILFLAFLFPHLTDLGAEESETVRTHHRMMGPAHFSTNELNILNMTFYFDRQLNYVEQSPSDQWYAKWLTHPFLNRAARGLASTAVQIDEGTASTGSPNDDLSSSDADYEQWKTLTYQRVRSDYVPTDASFPEIKVPGSNSSWSPVKEMIPLKASDGYQYYQNLVIQCATDYQPGDTCLVVGNREDYDILGLEFEPNPNARLPNNSQYSPSDDVGYTPSTEMARSSPPPTVAAVSVAPRPAPAATVVSVEQQRKSDVTFQSCQQTYDKALRLCGTSTRKPDRDFVLEKLKIVAPSHYAGYLTYVRQLNERSGDLVATCRATEEVAQSMTALNVYYENLCTNARNHCASECSNARAQSLDVNDINQSRSREFAGTCSSDMTLYAASGLFQHSEATRMLASAKNCKEKLAQLGPCSEARSWDSPKCQRHCQDPANASLPACVRYKVMNSNCSNPEFASQNSYCQQLDSSLDVVKGSPADSSPRKFTVPNFDTDRAGSFGSGMDADPKAAPLATAQQSKAEAPRSARNVYVNNTFQSESSKLAPESPEPGSLNFVMNFAEEFRSFWGRIRPQSSGQSRSQSGRASTHQRLISSEDREPEFNFAKYVFRTETDSKGQKKCYRGAELILCPDQDIFQAISRKYRSIAPQMNK